MLDTAPRLRNAAIVLLAQVFALLPAVCAQEYDIAIAGGRVMDPESGLDAARHVGIRDGKIAAIAETPLKGKQTIDATGLVVAPGFIDLHAHGMNAESSVLQAGDGVTTALEMEIGVFPVAPWYEKMKGNFLINYGATVSHLGARVKIKEGIDLGHSATADPELRAKIAQGGWAYAVATDEEIGQLAGLLETGLAEGALGLGFGIGYTPKASHREVFHMFQVAGKVGAPCFVHSRSGKDFSDGESVGAIQEIMANAIATGAPLHIVHINSTGGPQAKVLLEMVRGAKAHGMDITAEAYPYNASSTLLQSALFDGEDWEKESGRKYGDIMWVKTGERLTKETFDKYRKIGGWVVLFGMDEEMIEWLVSQPDVIIATDGIPFVDGKSHPRGAGSFARVLGHYVRERKVLGLMDALRKMTLMPAQRLESYVPMMKKKGRVAVGADADITVFNADTVIDKATFMEPAQHSEGIMHVLVGGIAVVRDNEPVPGVMPGRPIMSKAVAP